MPKDTSIEIPQSLEDWVHQWLFEMVQSEAYDLDTHSRVCTFARAISYDLYRRLSAPSSPPVPDSIDDMAQTIRRVTDRLIAEGPEACRKFLEDSGIISKSAPVSSPSIEPENHTHAMINSAELLEWMDKAIRYIKNGVGLVDAYDRGYAKAYEEVVAHVKSLRQPSIQEAPAVQEKTPVEEVPEEIMQWIKNESVTPYNSTTEIRCFQAGAIALYRYLDGKGMIIPEGTKWSDEIASLRSQLEDKQVHLESHGRVIRKVMEEADALKVQLEEKDAEIELLRKSGASLHSDEKLMRDRLKARAIAFRSYTPSVGSYPSENALYDQFLIDSANNLHKPI